ncbi:hypothetical protein CEXT_581891 [Caerostris extrusa]|uniref:Uncharacterized protein n=1 Tax=Caerostris extrusa TaxID=172846 RepID=A0AAV4R2D4_CAEEX|nr:hypothetical protein CEXT_581891 [Caerostris extrusa]
MTLQTCTGKLVKFQNSVTRGAIKTDQGIFYPDRITDDSERDEWRHVQRSVSVANCARPLTVIAIATTVVDIHLGGGGSSVLIRGTVPSTDAGPFLPQNNAHTLTGRVIFSVSRCSSANNRQQTAPPLDCDISKGLSTRGSPPLQKGSRSGGHAWEMRVDYVVHYWQFERFIAFPLAGYCISISLLHGCWIPPPSVLKLVLLEILKITHWLKDGNTKGHGQRKVKHWKRKRTWLENESGDAGFQSACLNPISGSEDRHESKHQHPSRFLKISSAANFPHSSCETYSSGFRGFGATRFLKIWELVTVCS